MCTASSNNNLSKEEVDYPHIDNSAFHELVKMVYEGVKNLSNKQEQTLNDIDNKNNMIKNIYEQLKINGYLVEECTFKRFMMNITKLNMDVINECSKLKS